ncbi:MAG TPA: amino acid permease [Candidatus Sulfotelmatobacter sp.]|nr:amino acid permease [Candidatus Sulfotelmatobacter sp.]
MPTSLFRRKAVEACQADADRADHRLKRSLGVVELTALGIGAVIGAGIFSSPGSAAAGADGRLAAGPALVLSYLLVAAACGLAALCYAEMASMVPVAGSAYTYAYVTLGEFLAWIIGWDLILEYAVGNVAVAVSWAAYFNTLLEGLGVHFPPWLCTTLDHAFKTPELLATAPHVLGIPIVLNLPAGLIVALLTILLVVGIQESARVNTAMVVLKLAMVVGFVLVGMFYVQPAHWTPFAPNGLNGILTGAAVIFFAYIGFDAISTTAEEAKNPQRDLPRAMIATLTICTTLYVAVTLVLTGMISWRELAVGDPLAKALQSAGLQALAGILSFGAVVAMTAVLLVFQLGQPRIFMVMARDGLLPEWAARVHPRFRTPYVTTILTGVFVGVPAMFVDINEAIDFTNIGTLFAFILVSVGVIVLRRTDPGRHRPFRCPGVPVLPLFSVVSCGILIAYLPVITWIRFVVWQAIGILLYFLYGRRHSRLTGRGKEVTWTPTTTR